MSTVRQYELVYITPPEITEEALADLHQQVSAVVDRFGGTIEKTENWGRRRLAYEINHQRPARCSKSSIAVCGCWTLSCAT